MRLGIGKSAAIERLTQLELQGYPLLNDVQQNFVRTGAEVRARVGVWRTKVEKELETIFPTSLECWQFKHPPPEDSRISLKDNISDIEIWQAGFMGDLLSSLRTLDKMILNLDRYTDLPLKSRLYVEDIDSFSKVRDVNPSMVLPLLKNGRLEWLEDDVQVAFEKILDVSFHKRDWGGEVNDLYTSNVIVNGKRHSTAFLLKGRGEKAHTLEIAHCGKQGDQIVRLLSTPADLYVIQFVGNVGEAVIQDIDGKVELDRLKSRDSRYCIIDGQDTARLLLAYGLVASGGVSQTGTGVTPSSSDPAVDA